VRTPNAAIAKVLRRVSPFLSTFGVTAAVARPPPLPLLAVSFASPPILFVASPS
jgi:hypothetical protein